MADQRRRPARDRERSAGALRAAAAVRWAACRQAVALAPAAPASLASPPRPCPRGLSRTDHNAASRSRRALHHSQPGPRAGAVGHDSADGRPRPRRDRRDDRRGLGRPRESSALRRSRLARLDLHGQSAQQVALLGGRLPRAGSGPSDLRCRRRLSKQFGHGHGPGDGGAGDGENSDRLVLPAPSAEAVSRPPVRLVGRCPPRPARRAHPFLLDPAVRGRSRCARTAGHHRRSGPRRCRRAREDRRPPRAQRCALHR